MEAFLKVTGSPGVLALLAFILWELSLLRRAVEAVGSRVDAVESKVDGGHAGSLVARVAAVERRK